MSIQIDQLIEKTTREIFKICFNGDSSTRLFYKQNKNLLTISKFHLFMNRACSKNHISIIKYVFEQKKFELVPINYLKMLDIARRNENKEIQELLKEKAKQLDILKLITRDDLHNVVFLKENNIELNQEHFIQCIVYGSINILRYLIEMKKPEEILIDTKCFQACIEFHQNEIFELLINQRSYFPEIYTDSLEIAVPAGNLYVLKYCLDHINSNSKLCDDYISSLILIAIEEQQLEILDYLLEKYSSLEIEIPHEIFSNLIREEDIDILNILTDYEIKATYEQIGYSISLGNLEVSIILLDAYKPSIPEFLKYSCVAHACRADNRGIIGYILEEHSLLRNTCHYDEFLEIAYAYENYDIAYYLIEEHLDRLESIDQDFINTIRSLVLKFKPQLPFTDKVPEHKECGICTLEMSTGENILTCTVCNNLTHTECYTKWGKNCVYCRN